MSKQVVTEDNYKQVVLKRMIAICWCILGLCFLVKIFGGNFFVIICENGNFIKICDYIESSDILKCIIGVINTAILETLYLLAISGKLFFKKKEIIFVYSFILISVPLRYFFTLFKYISDIFLYFILPFLVSDDFHFNVKTRRTVFAFILAFVFQLISMIVKNLSISYLPNHGILVGLIYSIDVYIMTVLYYLYFIKKEKNMGLFMDWLWGKSKKQLEKMKQSRLAKKAVLDKELAEIEQALKEQKTDDK